MLSGFLLKKLEMTQVYREDGELTAATICEARPCYITMVKTLEKDGYLAAQLAAGKKKRINKPMTGHFKKAKINFTPLILKEVGISGGDKPPELGLEIKVSDVLKPGFLADIVGVIKGRGFSGVIKRWGFHSQPKTHGQSDRERAPGSIGAQTPGRVDKGKKMPGHYGASRKTVRNIEILSVDEETQRVFLKGAIPGYKNSWFLIKPKKEKKNFIALRKPNVEKEQESEQIKS